MLQNVYIENIINTATISGIVVLHPPTAGMEGKEIKIDINKFIRVGMNKSIRLGWNKLVRVNSSL